MAVVLSEPDWSHRGRWEAPGPGRTVEPAAALTTELTEFWGLCGLVAPAHGAARLLVETRLQIWGFLTRAFRRRAN